MHEKPTVKRWVFAFLGVPPSCDGGVNGSDLGDTYRLLSNVLLPFAWRRIANTQRDQFLALLIVYCGL